MNTIYTTLLVVIRAKWMLTGFLLAVVSLLPRPEAMAASPATVDLLSADSFAVLAGTTVTCIGGTINGDVGVAPGTAFIPGGATVNGDIHLNDAVAAQAQLDLTTAYNDAAGRTSVDMIYLPQEIGGMTLEPGLYRAQFSELNITGNLTFDALGDANAVWIIQMATTITQASASHVFLSGGAQAKNIFWQVGSSATLGTYSTFKGNILAYTAITITTDTSLDGRALAMGAAVTFNGNDSTSTSFDVVTITSSAGPYGAISPNGSWDVTTGDNQTFTITPDLNAVVADVLVDGVSVGVVTNYTFTNVTEPHTIVASFLFDGNTITASAGTHGTISPVGPVAVITGSDQTFTITPDLNSVVVDVLVDGVSVGAVTGHTFTNVTEPHTIVASFLFDGSTITAAAGAHGTISPIGLVDVITGNDQIFTITPDLSAVVVDVLVDGVSVGAITNYTFTNVTESHTIVASFLFDGSIITAAAGAHGTISPVGPVAVITGSDQTFTIAPDLHYKVVDVLVDGVSVGVITNYTFTNVTEPHTIVAIFDKFPWLLFLPAIKHKFSWPMYVPSMIM